MTRPVNLYLLSRIPGEAAFNQVYHHAADKASRKKTAQHEMESLRIFTDRMRRAGLSLAELDGFFFSFEIPQIGKEFDLLKLRPDAVINVELKSQPVPLDQIRSQLLKNRHYLAHLGRTALLFTFVSDTREIYRLTKDDILRPASATDLAKAVQSFATGYEREIDGCFRASEYLVSPTGTPEKFLRGEYFLTQAQDQICKGVLEALSATTGCAYFSLTGKPGTGKTLLLYDIGRTLGRQAQTAILSWGPLAEGHRIINAAGTGLTILPWSVLDGDEAAGGVAIGQETAGAAGGVAPGESSAETGAGTDRIDALAACSYILVDESHKLSPDQFETICRTAKRFRQRVIFCLDPGQVLTRAEKQNDIAGRIESLPPAETFLLSEHLRGNRELRSFIRQVQDLRDRPKTRMDYRDVDLGYAATIAEAQDQLAWYRQQGYVFINYHRPAAGKPAPVLHRPESDPAPPAPRAGSEPAGSAPIQEFTPAAGKPASVLHRPESDPAPPAAIPGPTVQPIAAGADPFSGRSSAADPFAEFEGGYDIYHVIGQEFDRVVMLLDSSFCYNEEDRLEGVPRPDPDYLYPNLFYQGITRVREKLALIVLENEDLFDRIAGILDS